MSLATEDLPPGTRVVTYWGPGTVRDTNSSNQSIEVDFDDGTRAWTTIDRGCVTLEEKP